MKVKDVLKARSAITVKTTDTWDQARQVLSWSGIRHLMAMRGAALVGIVSERDLLRNAAEKGRLVEEFMSSPARVVGPETELAVAEVLMATEKLGCLPVLEGSDLIGILTTTDLLEFHGRGLAREAQ